MPEDVSIILPVINSGEEWTKLNSHNQEAYTDEEVQIRFRGFYKDAVA